MSYDSVLGRLRAGDTTIDYTSLRLAYTQTEDYSPYNFRLAWKKGMRSALEAKDYRRILVFADSILATNYVDIEAHAAAAAAHGGLGDVGKSRFHGSVARGLIESILSSASGRSADSAIVVISIEEEYALLAALGVQRDMQALATCAGRPCDYLTVTDPASGKSFGLYFDITLLSASFERKFVPDSARRTP